MNHALPFINHPSSFILPRLVPPEPEIALLVSTYEKPWHLERVLASVAMQEGVEGRMELVVTDDGSVDQTPQIVRQFAQKVRFPVSFATHPHQAFQLARCRNEGVRASKAPYLLFLDGDCVLPPNHVQEHLKRRRPNYATGADCCRLDQAMSARFDDEAIRSRKYLDWVSRSQLRALAKCYRKARFYQWIHHPTKPKLVGNNIGIWRRDYQRVNGYDENFGGWGCEDDDLRLRVRRAGIRSASILRWTHTYHLWHPADPSAPRKWRDGENVRYFCRQGRLTRCMNGLVKRSLDDLAVRVVGTPFRPEAAAALLGSRWADPCRADQAEVELLFLPGRGRFSGRADANILVVLDDSPQTQPLARKAHILVADRPCPGVPEEYCFKLTEFDQALGALG